MKGEKQRLKAQYDAKVAREKGKAVEEVKRVFTVLFNFKGFNIQVQSFQFSGEERVYSIFQFQFSISKFSNSIVNFNFQVKREFTAFFNFKVFKFNFQFVLYGLMLCKLWGSVLGPGG